MRGGQRRHSMRCRRKCGMCKGDVNGRLGIAGGEGGKALRGGLICTLSQVRLAVLGIGWWGVGVWGGGVWWWWWGGS